MEQISINREKQANKPIYCRNQGCNVEITFDPNIKSKSGRLIPVEKSSGLNHQCKFSEYALKQRQQVNGSNGNGNGKSPNYSANNIEHPISSTKAETQIQGPNDKITRTYFNIMVEKLTNIESKLDKVLEVRA